MSELYKILIYVSIFVSIYLFIYIQIYISIYIYIHTHTHTHFGYYFLHVTYFFDQVPGRHFHANPNMECIVTQAARQCQWSNVIISQPIFITFYFIP